MEKFRFKTRGLLPQTRQTSVPEFVDDVVWFLRFLSEDKITKSERNSIREFLRTRISHWKILWNELFKVMNFGCSNYTLEQTVENEEKKFINLKFKVKDLVHIENVRKSLENFVLVEMELDTYTARLIERYEVFKSLNTHPLYKSQTLTNL